MERSRIQFIEGAKSVSYNLRRSLLIASGIAIVASSLFLGGCGRIPSRAQAQPQTQTQTQQVQSASCKEGYDEVVADIGTTLYHECIIRHWTSNNLTVCYDRTYVRRGTGPDPFPPNWGTNATDILCIPNP